MPTTVFQARIEKYNQAVGNLKKKHNQISTFRLCFFLCAVLGLFFLWQEQQYGLFAVATAVSSFVFLTIVKWHQRIGQQRDYFKALSSINQDELGRISLSFTRPETGRQYLQTNHAYCYDLDIFGEYSLFRLLNRTYTQLGSQKLANWLSNNDFDDEIETTVRQKAIIELKNALDWRQEFQAIAHTQPTITNAVDFLLTWVKSTQNQIIKKYYFLRWLPLFTLLVWLFIFIGTLPTTVGWLLLVVHLFVLGRIKKSIDAFSTQSTAIVSTLKVYGKLIKKIENQTFESDKFKHLQAVFKNQNVPASESINQFAKYVENLNFRLNAYFWLFVGLPTLWDLQWFARVEKWKSKHQNQLEIWLNALAEFEALNSLAGFAFANPDYVFADFSPEKVQIKAQQIGHPLIRKEKRIANDFEMGDLGQTVLITGSNMSGKSTFLRTVGINLILAKMGSVVCAKAFCVSTMRIFTSMRTQDSIAENTSSFYAELKRLETLLTTINAKGAPVLYFLDEILKGTNSTDRQRGAEALIKQLHLLNASGFVSTHDLGLSNMANTSNFVKNFSFHSIFVAGQLHFDYQLQHGICQEANAAALMRQIGIDLME